MEPRTRLHSFAELVVLPVHWDLAYAEPRNDGELLGV